MGIQGHRRDNTLWVYRVIGGTIWVYRAIGGTIWVYRVIGGTIWVYRVIGGTIRVIGGTICDRVRGNRAFVGEVEF